MPDKFVIPSPRPGPFVPGPDAQRQPGVPRGTVTKAEWRSTIFPGTLRDHYVYVPAQYTPDVPANVMVFQDGWSYANEEGDVRAPIVFDNLIRKTPRKPIRVYLQASCNDLDCGWGNWSLANLEMASALNFAGYDYRLDYGDGAHDFKHGGATLPEALTWLWR